MTILQLPNVTLHGKTGQKVMTPACKQRVIMHSSLKFSIVINHTLKTEERVHSNKGTCQDNKTKPASKNNNVALSQLHT